MEIINDSNQDFIKIGHLLNDDLDYNKEIGFLLRANWIKMSLSTKIGQFLTKIDLCAVSFPVFLIK